MRGADVVAMPPMAKLPVVGYPEDLYFIVHSFRLSCLYMAAFNTGAVRKLHPKII